MLYKVANLSTELKKLRHKLPCIEPRDKAALSLIESLTDKCAPEMDSEVNDMGIKEKDIKDTRYNTGLGDHEQYIDHGNLQAIVKQEVEISDTIPEGQGATKSQKQS